MSKLGSLVRERILILDGAMGTMIQQYNLTEGDFRGERFSQIPGQMKGNNDLLCLTRPDVIQDIHRKYLAAGADIIETNTFSSTRVSMADYHVQDYVREMNLAAVRLARKVADEFTSLTPDKPRFVAGSVGPTNKTCSMSPDVNNPAFRALSYDELADAYREQMEALLEGGVDALLIETIFDTLNAKAAIFAAGQAMETVGVHVPLMLSVTVSEIVEEDSVEEPKETSGVPLNEDGKPDFSATIRMPELKIPKSMINVDPENASSAAGIPDASGIFGSIDEIAAEVAKDKKADEEPEKEQEFNLEDTILAAASEQGINIPEEEKSPDVQQSEVTEETEDEEDLDIAADEFVPEEPDAADIEDIMAQISAQQAEDVSESAHRRIPDLVLDEDEEPVTEEDMQAAEAEFLNGPTGVQKPDTKDEFDGFDDLKEEEQLKEMPEDLSLEDEDISLEDESDDRRADKLTDDVVIPVEDETPLDEEEEFSDDDFGFKDEPEDDEEDDFISSLTEDMEEDDEEEELSEEEQLERFIEDMQPEIDPNTIISRKRQLTDEEKQLFTYFVAVPGMKEQLVDVLCDVQKGAADKTSQTGNVIVMGGRETGKTRLISSLIPAICRELNIEASKVAYIFAEDLNGKNIAEIASKLAGGFLVIENANQLSQETADELDEVMNGNTKSMIVILEDEKIGMRKLIARYPKLAKKFTSMINIPVFTNDELVNFAKVYTMENGFRIDQMGMLALYNLIGINQKEDQPVCIGTVKTMLDNAMAKAQGGLFKRSKKRVDRDGFTVLLEKDFS